MAIVITIACIPTTAFAHSKVTPSEVGVAEDQTFAATVENEKEIPTVKVRLVLPGGLEHVEAFAKNGWTISTVKDGDEVKEIIWSNGNLPAELKDSFTFNAQAPGNETELTWKIYQTYEDGTEVAWANTDKDAKDTEGSDTGPASFTKVINDLAAENSSIQQDSNNGRINLAIGLSVLSTVLAAFAVTRKKT